MKSPLFWLLCWFKIVFKKYPHCTYDISTVYPQRTYSIPTTYPQRTYNVPTAYLQRTYNVPTTYLQGTYNLPTTYLQGTYNVPTTYLQCTHKIPLKTPAWKPQPFPSCLNAHNFGNKDYRCRELVSQHRLLPPTYPQTPFFLNPFPHNLILFKQLTYCCYVKH